MIRPFTLIPDAPLLVIFNEEPLFVIVPELSRLIPAAPVLEISVLPVFVIEPRTFKPFAPLFEISKILEFSTAPPAAILNPEPLFLTVNFVPLLLIKPVVSTSNSPALFSIKAVPALLSTVPAIVMPEPVALFVTVKDVPLLVTLAP